MKTFISDKYRIARGGWSRYLQVRCESCDYKLFNYQKDGPGPLKRSYMDRIIGQKPKFDKHGIGSVLNARLAWVLVSRIKKKIIGRQCVGQTSQ